MRVVRVIRVIRVIRAIKFMRHTPGVVRREAAHQGDAMRGVVSG